MAADLEGLINDLERPQSGYSEVSPRDRAIVALQEHGSEAAPVLISRLDGLLTEWAEYFARVDSVLKVWRQWYDESEQLSDVHGVGADVERYRLIPTSSLPDRPARPVDNSLLVDGLITALHRIGDVRAGAVLCKALADPVGIDSATLALRDIRVEGAKRHLLDAAARVKLDDRQFRALVETVRDYGVSVSHARTRLAAETNPEGRVRLWRLVNELATSNADRLALADIRDPLVYMAMDSPPDRWEAMLQLSESGLLGDARDQEPWNREYEAPPSPGIVSAAIVLAGRDEPKGFGYELRRRVRQVVQSDNSESAAPGVLAALHEQIPGASAAELVFTLELAKFLAARNDLMDDPMDLVRPLYRLSLRSEPQIKDRALGALYHGWMLFEQMAQRDQARSEEATMIFEETARPEDRDRYQDFLSVNRPWWKKLLRLTGAAPRHR
ncbi:hypothetical protein [Glycomyces albidus]|uniref:Uncharacterized protein n=1 Tax=Glycomyces albidus TaxID=2656774 RepID=A0A6L5GE57_9ACTN|nr:hypothetical protein [Glycomyces albidus]MQM27918.1 hypothetical protein [Glycomyces albidus]